MNGVLEIGVAGPGGHGLKALEDWISRCDDAGWPEIARLGRTFLDDSSSADDMAEVFTRILIWYESIRHEYDMVLLKREYGLDHDGVQ